jgi:phosphatidylinositol alpha-mannosyltransferase
VCPYDLGRFGGVQDQVIKLSSWLRDAGHDAVVVGPGSEGPEGSVLVGSVRTVRANGSDVPAALGPSVIPAVASALEGCDVVHVHEPLMPLVSLAAMFRSKAPVVATFHAAPPPFVKGVYRTGRVGVRRVLDRAAVVTAVSPVAAGSVGELTSVWIVPNGLDVAEYRPAARDPRRVIFVGRDEPRKGLDILLEAWPAVRSEHPDAQLVVVGAERRDGAPPDVRFLGRLDEHAKRAELATSGIACAPNLGGESFGIVVAEMMASACAVVASALPGFVHVCGDAAQLVKPADPEGLAWGLARVLADEDLATSLSRAGRERVMRFDRSKVLAGYLAAYEEALVSA